MKYLKKRNFILITLVLIISIFFGEIHAIGASKKVTVIGDSVLLGAASSIKKVMPGSTVDGKVSRQAVKGKEVAKQLQSKGKLNNVVVIALGTNGPFRESVGQDLINYLGKKRRIYWVTVYGKRLKWMNTVNSTIHKLANKNSNVSIIDWAAVAASHSNWLYKDGIHLQPKGREAYAKLIKSKIK